MYGNVYILHYYVALTKDHTGLFVWNCDGSNIFSVPFFHA